LGQDKTHIGLSGRAEQRTALVGKTRKGKGTLFKRDETKLLNVSGYRRTLCGFIELRSRGVGRNVTA
jgi:hypothetical protein